MKELLARPGRSPIASLDRGLEALDILARSGHSLSSGELARILDVDKSTASRILSTLTARGLVEQENGSKRFILGLRCLEYAGVVLSRLDLRTRAQPFARELLDATGESVNICILDGADVIYLDRLDSPSVVSIAMRVGSRVPAHCVAVGKVLLANLPPEQFAALYSDRELMKYTARTVSSLAQLNLQLAGVREHGVAIDDEEFYPGMRGVAAPVRNYAGHVVASIGIAGLATRVTMERMPELIRLVRQAADKLSRSLGYSQ